MMPLHAPTNEHRFHMGDQGMIVCTDHASLDFGTVLAPTFSPGQHGAHVTYVHTSIKLPSTTLDALALDTMNCLPAFSECTCVKCQMGYRFMH